MKRQAIITLVALACLIAFWGSAAHSDVATGTEYVTFWSGQLRIIAQEDSTLANVYNINSGALMHSILLDEAGDMWTRMGGIGGIWDELEVRIVTEDATGLSNPIPRSFAS